MRKRILAGLAAVAAIVGLGSLAIHGVNAADHTDPASVTGSSEDIADLYAWANPTNGKFYAIISYAGLSAPVTNQQGTYDRDSLFSLYIDTDGNSTNASTHRINFRFAQNSTGAWGVKAENVPNGATTTTTISGPVGTVQSSAEGQRIYAGLADDPFFFDLTGFQATLSSGDLAFDKDRDTFAGTNTTVIAIELDAADLGSNVTNLQVWASASTISGT